MTLIKRTANTLVYSLNLLVVREVTFLDYIDMLNIHLRYYSVLCI